MVGGVAKLADLDYILLFENATENAIIGADKTCLPGEYGDGASLRANARIDYDNMDCFTGKVRCGCTEHISSLMDVLRRNGMGDIDDCGARQNIKDCALHAGDIRAGQTEVGGEGDGRWGFAKRSMSGCHTNLIVTVNNRAEQTHRGERSGMNLTESPEIVILSSPKSPEP